MKYLLTIVITAALVFSLSACGGGNSGEAAGEKNELSVVFSDKEDNKPGAFELKKTLAFISGMRYNAKSTAKLVYVAFANYEVKLGLYAIEMPKEPGQIVIVVSFKTENKVMPMQQQMEEYAKMKVPTGTFEPCWMGSGKCFQATYYVGGQSGGQAISGSGASGTATLTTSTAEKVSGSIDFTSVNGSTMKGTFNVKIEKDLWKN